jgi:hypothetical protein
MFLPQTIGYYWLLQCSNPVSIGSHSDQTSFQSSSLYLWALGKHSFVKISSSTLCCTVFLYNVFVPCLVANAPPLNSDPLHPFTTPSVPLHYLDRGHQQSGSSLSGTHILHWATTAHTLFLYRFTSQRHGKPYSRSKPWLSKTPTSARVIWTVTLYWMSVILR